MPPDPTPSRPALAVWADPPEDVELLRTAARLSVDLNLPLAEPGTGPWEALLLATPTRLEIRWNPPEEPSPKKKSKKKQPKPHKKPLAPAGRGIFADLESIDITSGPGRRLNQPIAKAVGIKSSSTAPVVIDATAGWGEDAWLLAALGCRVLLVERNKVVATLLRDGLLRAASRHPDMLHRLHVVQADSFHLLRRAANRTAGLPDEDDLPASMAAFLAPDVVYLDPMFPTESRKAAERKPMRLLRRLVGDDLDAARLLDVALRVARKRVVIKRPLHAPPLGPQPTTTHKGKAARYDVYAITSKP